MSRLHVAARYIYPYNWYLIRNRSSLLKSSACNPMQSNEEIFLENRTLHNTQRLTHRRTSVELLYETRKFQLVSCRFSHHKMKKNTYIYIYIYLSFLFFFAANLFFDPKNAAVGNNRLYRTKFSWPRRHARSRPTDADEHARKKAVTMSAILACFVAFSAV